MATLLLHSGTMLSTDQLIEQLWDDPPETARPQVHNAIAALRRVLAPYGGENLISTHQSMYRITVRPDQVDLSRFTDDLRAAAAAEESGDTAGAARQLRTALGQWSGPAMSGVGGHVLSAAAARLEEQRLAAHEKLLALRLRLGEHDFVIDELIELVDRHRLRESSRASLMLAYFRSGRQSEALQVYDEGRRVLRDELGLEPGPELRSLHARVLQGDPELMDTGARTNGGPRRPPAAPAEQPEVRPSFLPPGTRDFTGRGAELELLLGEVGESTGDATTIVTIDGMGGVGKTTLAVHLGHRLAERYPDGQYFIDLHGYTAGKDPLSPAAALDLLLRAAGVPADLIQPDLDGRVVQWRSHLAGRRVLVVLDNAIDESHVRLLLPGSPSALVLVTTRRRLSSLDAAIPVSLDLLPLDDAIDLFGRVAGLKPAEPDHDRAIAVVELCGRLPLAIRMAASRLRHHRTWTVSHLEAMLRDQQRRGQLLTGRDRSVGAVLEMSYRHLAEDEQRLFRALGMLPGTDFGVHAVAATVDLPVEDTRELLEHLFDAHLVLQHAEGRFHLHDLVRDFARGLAERSGEEEERTALRRRILDYHVRLAHECCRPIARAFAKIDPDPVHRSAALPATDSEPAAMALLEAEVENLVAVAHIALEQRWADDAWQLPCVLSPFFSRINYWENTLDVFRAAHESAKRSGSIRGEAAALTNIALILRDRGHYDEVRRLLLEAIELSRQLEDEPTVSYLLTNLGIARVRAGDMPGASDTFSQARQIAIRLGDRQAYASFTNNLGAVASRMGKPDKALAHFSEAMELCTELGFRLGQATTHLNIGDTHLISGAPEAALEHLDRALTISREISFRLGEAFGLCYLASAHRRLGRFTVAELYGRQALQLSREAGLREVECDTLNTLGETELSAGRPGEAEQAFTEARSLAVTLHLPLATGRAEEGLAHVARFRGDLDGARRAWERALERYPDEIGAARYARAHLASPFATCPRCRQATLESDTTLPG